MQDPKQPEATCSKSSHQSKHFNDFCIFQQWQSESKSLSYVIYRWIVASLFCIYMAGWFIEDIIKNTGILIDFIYLTNISLLVSTVTMIMSAYSVTSHYKGTYEIADNATKIITIDIFEILSSTSSSMTIVVSVNYRRLLVHNSEKNA